VRPFGDPLLCAAAFLADQREVPQLPARADAAGAAREFRDVLATEQADRARIADKLTGKAWAS
jgi:hypothetical protein